MYSWVISILLGLATFVLIIVLAEIVLAICKRLDMKIVAEIIGVIVAVMIFACIYHSAIFGMNI